MDARPRHHTAGEQTVRLLDLDPDLGASLRPERLEEARRSATAPARRLPRGPLDAAGLVGAREASYGVHVVDGLIGRSVRLRETTASQLLGRGDIVSPGREQAAVTLIPTEVRWRVLEPATVAFLDERFLLAVRRWPELVAALFERLASQSARLATHCAISQLPRVEDRLQLLLWFLAERWGRMTVEGVVLPLKLTHDTLGQLIGAKRPTVSLALRALEARGAIRRRAGGGWLLARDGADPSPRAPDDAVAWFVRERGASPSSPVDLRPLARAAATAAARR